MFIFYGLVVKKLVQALLVFTVVLATTVDASNNE